ncbi:MAG: aminotransferase class V-fold PLP-dependent enzyme, partial [Gloeomargaritaceae cyanobacterium C42_A2020_066]|nr:aminotransferase class V-fold PLP-dependent enzyme [Gloeomargaritaceae cyanobacterium C42_A2020_066]
NLADFGADWYAGNAHKWLFTPKGCGFLYTAPRWQAQTQPLVISWGRGEGYTAGFDWPGTRDLSNWLAIPTALDFYRDLGPAALRRHNHDLAWTAGRLLAQTWGVPCATPEALIGAMMTLPLPEPWHGRPHLAQAIHDQLLHRYRIEVPIVPFGDRLWLRISAQVYNHLGEYERLAEVFTASGGFDLTG